MRREPEDFPAAAALVKDGASARCMCFDCTRTGREARAVLCVSTWLCGSPVALRRPYSIALWFSLLCCVCRSPRPQQSAPAQDPGLSAVPEERQNPQGSSGSEERAA